jgi:hypothetical protein
MANNWIKFVKSNVTDGRIRQTAKRCNAKTVTILGALVTLWSFADDHLDNNGVLIGWTFEDFNDEVDVENFCQSLPDSWIALSDQGFIQLPNYLEHNGETAKQRALSNKRVAKNRAQKKCNAKTVTGAKKVVTQKTRPEERREDKIREEEIKEKKKVKKASSYSKGFLDFWEVYPKKIGKGIAAKSYTSAVKRVSEEHDIPKAESENIIQDAIENFAVSDKGLGEFCPNPSTWLNQSRWDDDPIAWEEKNVRESKTGQSKYNQGRQVDF